jgi:hypothetical protein
VQTGIHVVRTIAAIFPYLILERKSEAWSNTEGRLNGLLKRPDGCKLDQKLLDTDECSDGNPRRESGRYGTLSGRLELCTDERPDGMTCRLDDW